MNEKHREVAGWLEKVFGEGKIPKYEINTRNINILHRLMQVNEHKDRQAPVILQDLQEKADDYSYEGEWLRAKLSHLGLTTSSLSQSGIASLQTVCNVAQVLDVNDASNTTVLLAMSDFTQERLKIQDMRLSERNHCEQLLNNAASALQELAQLRRVFTSVRNCMGKRSSELEKKAKQARFLHSKASEYRKQIHRLQIELVQNGGTSDIYHPALVKKTENLVDIREQIQPLKARLDSYHRLPPDLPLARVKLEECRRELMSIEEELAKHIDLMHT